LLSLSDGDCDAWLIDSETDDVTAAEFDIVDDLRIGQSLGGQFSFSGNISAEITLTNNGNSHTLSRTFLRAEKIGSDEPVLSKEAQVQIVLPGTNRQLSLNLDSPKFFARYKVWSEVIFGTPSTSIVTSPVEVIVISPLVIIVSLISILSLATFISLRATSIRRLSYSSTSRRHLPKSGHFSHPRKESEKKLIKKNK